MYCCYTLIDTRDFETFYVGKTALKNLDARKAQHKYESKRSSNKKSNKIRKLLREGYDFEIIPTKFYLTEEEAYEDEPNVIQWYKDRNCNLCNATEGGEGLRNPSPETRVKMAKIASKRFSGDGNPSKRPEVKKLRSEFFKKNNPMHNPAIKEKALKAIKASCSKPVLQFDKEGNFLQEFDGIKEAARQVGIGHNGILNCCKSRLKTSGGFMWKYKEVR